MSGNYLHGVETIELDNGPRPITLVKSAVVALVGTAAAGPVNQAILVTQDTDADQFGEDVPGSTIRDALDAVFDHSKTAVIVVNVCDPAVHKTAVLNSPITVNSSNVAVLLHKHVSAVVVKNSAAAITYTLGTDYTLDTRKGTVTRVPAGAITAGQALAISYDYVNPALVTNTDIIGTVSGGGVRTGMQLFRQGLEQFGFYAKIFIAPVFSTQTAIVTELASLADFCRGMSYVDAPIGITPAVALAGRGPLGAINFNTSHGRTALCYPHLKALDMGTNTEQLVPHSSRRAGLRAKIDQERGFWFSESNHEFAGITGIERLITSRINDPASEANLLNEAGICTVFNAFGTGIRAWGNRAASFPSVTHPKNFIPVRRTADIIAESIEYFTLQFIDRPLNRAWFDSVTESINGFLRKLVADGAIIDGRCWADPARNTPTELAAGHAYIDYDFLPPSPAERVTYNASINIGYYKSIFG
jgi:uncharacterized protein